MKQVRNALKQVNNFAKIIKQSLNAASKFINTR